MGQDAAVWQACLRASIAKLRAGRLSASQNLGRRRPHEQRELRRLGLPRLEAEQGTAPAYAVGWKCRRWVPPAAGDRMEGAGNTPGGSGWVVAAAAPGLLVQIGSAGKRYITAGERAVV